MDAGLSNTLRVLTLVAIGGGLPAWAIFGSFPGPTQFGASPTAAKPPHGAPPPMAKAPPRAKVIGVEPLPTPGKAPLLAKSSLASTVAPVSPPAGDRLNVVQDRLKQLGAYYLLLESMPGHSPHYRFHAAFGSGPSDSTGRRFEATDSQPMRAMERVLAEVEQWSAQRISARGRELERR